MFKLLSVDNTKLHCYNRRQPGFDNNFPQVKDSKKKVYSS